MKTRIFFFILSLAALVSIRPAAGNAQEARTLLGDGSLIDSRDLGLFASPGLSMTPMDGSTAALFLFRAGVSLKDRFSAGGYFNTSLNRIMPESETISGIYMDYWSVGGFLEYTLMSKKLVHLTFPVLLGYGEVQMDNEDGEAGLGEANFFQVEPCALLELNVHKFLRVHLGGGYRFVSPMTYRNFDQGDLSGWTAHVGLKVGLFR